MRSQMGSIFPSFIKSLVITKMIRIPLKRRNYKNIDNDNNIDNNQDNKNHNDDHGKADIVYHNNNYYFGRQR